ncbi:helix-turn-helix domain-containing protein [Sporosarcina limicola]|uniref:Transcriptional regulator with XRE-family HTH domain n=1 Tax=Sporosarcina limicola TaxID=34101 RepID=A0A927MQ08_9BACL|nr:Rgg/GadR/MutR family transcriptional regulator [Sporosarcina limicola]MBE1557167.1 transcriptional regulator with XRE-family HTH domain [Sporosarcina limicola]
MSNYGSSIKSIRKNKGYTQKEVAANLFTQATYSNFEADKTDILSTSFMHLLSQLHISSDELRYIHNDYQYDESTKIAERFFSLPYNDRNEILQILRLIEAYYLKGNSNIILNDLKIICEALLIIESSGDLLAAREKVNKVWVRISRFDQWYLVDLKIMNVILYFFESDVVIYITDKLIERLKVYQGFDEAIKLKKTLTINLSLILIKSGMISEALNRLEDFLQLHLSELSYKSLAVCFNRIAICYSYISKEKEIKYTKKIERLLEVYEDEPFKEKLQLEYKKYCNLKNKNM